MSMRFEDKMQNFAKNHPVKFYFALAAYTLTTAGGSTYLSVNHDILAGKYAPQTHCPGPEQK